ncbi:MAG: right-handed parallel beta-helix repeat-containing protein [Ardenticatenia bacterium]|nr:right-handed parallel beta-helix repeat-containing protein [Ardenticatenia bacterium]
MQRSRIAPRTLILAAFLLSLALGQWTPVHAQTVIFVNSTVDQGEDDEDRCRAEVPCTFRRAINTAQLELNGAIVRACFDPTEVPGARPCPAGAEPLRKSDPNFDPATGKWVMKMSLNLEIILTNKLVFVDFRQGLTWKSPADNRIVVDGGDVGLEYLISMESDTNILAGFDFRGTYKRAGMVLQGGIINDDAEGNQIGPGIVFADIKGPDAFSGGHALQITGLRTSRNKVVGNWCGIKGDGTVLAPVSGDCINLEQGTFGNVIGDAMPGNQNYFAAGSTGIRLEDSDFVGLEKQTKNNAIEYNVFGVNPKGQPTNGLTNAILISYAPGNRIHKNTIAASKQSGIQIQNPVTGTLITDNTIGAGIDGKTCMQNGGDGIQLVSGPNETVISGNAIFCNKGNGITIQGKASRGNTLSRNSITGNQGKSISISSNANDDIKPPRLDELTESTLAGVACAGCTVEVYSDMDKQADVYEGMVVAGADGAFTFAKPDGFLYRYVTALATNGKNSSALATAKLIPGTHVARTPTPTATPTEWGATAGPTSATPATPTPRPSGTVPTTAVPTATGALTPPTATMTATGPEPATRTPTLATPGTKKTIHLPWAQKP